MMTMNAPTYCGPMIDGKIVAESTEAALLAGHQAKVPVIIGANSSEFGFGFARNMDELMAQFGPDRDQAIAAFDPNKTGDVRAVGSLIGSDKAFVEPARFVARQVRAAGQPAYEYRFSYVAESMRKEWKGAPHATEIPFVFDTVAARYGDKLTAPDRAAAAAAHAYWVSFAKTGDPNGSGRPAWPLYESSADQLMNFTEQGPAPQADPWKTRLDLLEKAAAKKP